MDAAETLRLARDGDSAAMERFVAAHQERVRELVHQQLNRDFRRSHRWILPLFSTGDIVQDVFLSVIRSGELEALPTDDDGLVRYLATVVHHRLIDAVRHHESARRDRRRVVEPGATGPTPLDPAVDASASWVAAIGEQVDQYRVVLAKMPERQRLLLDLRLSDELPFEELAERLAYPSADTARKAFRKAQATLLVRLRAAGVREPGDTLPDPEA